MAGWQNEPFKIEIKKGEMRALCMCGKSSNGPLCDGTHKEANTDATPEIYVAEKDETLFVCGCQESGKRPFCDGTHKKL